MTREFVGAKRQHSSICLLATALCLAGTLVSPDARVLANERGEPVRIDVFPESAVFDSAQDSARFVVTGHYADGTVLDLTQKTDFVVEDTDIARLDDGAVLPVFPNIAPTARKNDEPAYRVTEVFDLRKDFSTTDNPNGSWRFERADGEVLSRFDPQNLGGSDSPLKPSPGWRLPNSPTAPSIAKALDPKESGMPHDLDSGDVFGHGPLSIRWTAPRDGAVFISGNAWMLRDLDRVMPIRLVHSTTGGSTVLFDVHLPERDADGDGKHEGPTSERPFRFDTAIRSSGVASDALLGQKVAAGDSLAFVAEGGDFIAMEFRVAYLERPSDQISGRSTAVNATVAGHKISLPITVRSRRVPDHISFRYGANAALAKQGCSQGKCHGAEIGKGGFQLSLRGYDPESDLESLVREDFGRRTNPYEPEKSLLIRKPMMDVEHGGGRQLRKSDPAYDILLSWIRQGCRDDPPGYAKCTKLEIFPRRRTLKRFEDDADWTQQFVALGHFSDGSVRNVTDLAMYSVSDERFVHVDERGLATGLEMGESAVTVRYLEHAESAHMVFLENVEGYAWNDAPENNYVDRLTHDKLKTFQILPSGPSTDGEFFRRIHLDVLGVLPTVDEAKQFLSDKDPGKRGKLIEKIVDRPEYATYWALRWGDLLRVKNKLLTPRGVHKMHEWLAGSFRHNQPYTEFARDLIAAAGSTFENPATNYYRSARDVDDRMQTTAQLFLGIRMQCAKCHNHPFSRWTQDNYYGLSAFFGRLREKKGTFPEEKIVFEARSGEVSHPKTGQPAKPWLPLVGEIEVGDDIDRREALVSWMGRPDNPYFARMEVNRIWSYLFGRGIVEPADDFRESNLPSNGPLLNALAKDFVESGYDRKHILKTIIRSQTYQRSSRPNALNADDDRYFSRYSARLLTAEPLLDAVSAFTGVPEKFPGVPASLLATQLPSPDVNNSFLKSFGQPERDLACACERSNEFSLTQALQMINGDLVQRKLHDEKNLLRKLANSEENNLKVVEELYLTGYARRPSEVEMQEALAHIGAQKSRVSGIEDIGWAILNTKEFLFQH